MKTRKIKRLLFSLLMLFWVISELFSYSKPTFAQALTTVDKCGTDPVCIQTVGGTMGNGVKLQVLQGGGQSVPGRATIRVIKRATGEVVSQTTATGFNTTVGQWVAGGGALGALGGGLIWLGLANPETAKQITFQKWKAQNPGNEGQPGQVPGKLYTIIANFQDGTSRNLVDDAYGPVNFNKETYTWAGSPYWSVQVYTPGGGIGWTAKQHNFAWSGTAGSVSIKRKDGTSEKDDKEQDPNYKPDRQGWDDMTPGEKGDAVNGLNPTDITGLVNHQPIPDTTPNGVNDVEFKPEGGPDWIPIPNPVPPLHDPGGDTDGDGVPNGNDPDDDGDGVPNVNDPDSPGYNPNDPNSDLDGDGIPNKDDPDDDNDGIPDVNDPDSPTYNPNDPNSDPDNDGVPNKDDPDDDGDGKPDAEDPNAPGSPNGELDKITFSGQFFVTYAQQKLINNFPFDIFGNPSTGSPTNECPTYTFYDKEFEACILRDAIIALKIPFQIGMVILFYQRL